MSKRFINLTTALVLAAGSISGVAPLLFSQTASAAGSCGGSYNMCINEFETDDGLGGSWVEIYNPANTDLTGYQVYNSGGANTTIVAAEDPTDTYVTVPVGTSLNKSGDEILLKDGAATIDSVTYGNIAGDDITAPAQNQSAGRAFDGYGSWQIFTSPSKDATNNNHGPLVTNVTYNDGSGTKPLTAGTVLSGTVTISADAYSPSGIDPSFSHLFFLNAPNTGGNVLDSFSATDATVSGNTYSWTIDTTQLSQQGRVKGVELFIWDNSPSGNYTHDPIALTVNNNAAPVITSNGGGSTASVSMPENQTAVTTVTATDANNDSLTYSITGGADANQFTIGSSSGKLTFKSTPSFANPTDADGDGDYEVTVGVSDGHGGSDSQAITVSVVADITPPVISDATYMLGNSAPSQTLADGVSLTGHVFFSFKLSDPSGIATGIDAPSMMIMDNGIGHPIGVALNGDTYTGQYFTTAIPPIYAGLPEDDNATITIYATDTAGNDASKTFTVRIDHTAPAAPALVSPKDKATITNNQPQLKWSILSNSDATHFKVQLSQDPNFVNGVGGTNTTSLTYTPSGPLSNGTWYWRVQACDAATNCSAWSESNFSIGKTTNPTTPKQPGSGSDQSNGGSQNGSSTSLASSSSSTNSSANSGSNGSSSSSSSNASQQPSPSSSNSSQPSKNNKPTVKLETPAKKTNKANNGGFNANWLWLLLLLLVPIVYFGSKKAAGGNKA